MLFTECQVIKNNDLFESPIIYICKQLFSFNYLLIIAVSTTRFVMQAIVCVGFAGYLVLLGIRVTRSFLVLPNAVST